MDWNSFAILLSLNSHWGVKLGLHGLGHFFCHIPWHPKFVFSSKPQTCASLQVCRSCLCVCTSMYTGAENQFCITNLHIVSIKQLYENKGACSFLVIQSSHCLLARRRPKWTITVFCSDLEVAAALHSILPCTKSIKGESKICNKSK